MAKTVSSVSHAALSFYMIAFHMAQLLVRNIPDALVLALKELAAAHGRSAEAEHRLILEKALWIDRNEFRERARRLRAETAGRIKGESADLIRENCDAG